MKHLHAFGKLAFTAIATAALAACGGSDSPTTKAPAFKLEIASTEGFPGTYGDVGEYETVKGTLSGEVEKTKVEAIISTMMTISKVIVCAPSESHGNTSIAATQQPAAAAALMFCARSRLAAAMRAPASTSSRSVCRVR